ncbi:amidohydrolase family protein [Pontibacter sp. JAM-7]|uniref:amidohydrolase family protein n=1 Tax=Pontibacter sp. JAM-7 TaxID=3366581 RepID=UPI003AF7DDCE
MATLRVDSETEVLRIIDPHVHLFDLMQGHYDWLQDGQPPYWPHKQRLQRNFLEQDLILPAHIQLAGFVHIEAGFDNQRPWREQAWLQQHCALPFRSIGFADLTSTDFAATLTQLAKFPNCIGIRNILAEDAAAVLQSASTGDNLALLEQQGMLLELQVNLQSVAVVNCLVDLAVTRSQLDIVLNHAGLVIDLEPRWCEAIQQLAHLPNCFVKCSGWEMLNADWRMSQVVPILQYLLQALPTSQLMLASNFPVSELALSYAELWQHYVDQLGKTLPAELFFDNARRVYRFGIG